MAGTNRGTILRLNPALEVEASSDPAYNLNAIFAIAFDDRFIYGREITGKVARWRKDSLTFDKMIDLSFWNDDDAANFPNVSHFFHIHEDHLYVAMPSGKIGKIRLSDFSLVSISKTATIALVEDAVTTPTEDVAVDFLGHLYRGRLDGEMKQVMRLSHGATHQLVFDQKHQRYWCTDDFHCGLAIFNMQNPEEIQRLYLTKDDVEFMSFNSDQSELLVACFDRYIYRLRNDKEPQIIGRIGPLKYQITTVLWIESDTAIALTEAGEIYRLHIESGEMAVSRTGTNAVWDLKKSKIEDDVYWAAFEDGYVREILVKENEIQTRRQKNLNCGMIRRILPQADGTLFAIATAGTILKLTEDLEIIWTSESTPLLRDMTVYEDRLLVCGESGELICLDTDSGKKRWTRDLGEPLWAVTITPDGRQFLVAHRMNDRGDQGTTSTRTPAHLIIGDLKTGEVHIRFPVFGNIKKFTWINNEQFLMNGNGDVGASLVELKTLQTVKRWSEWQLNTCEAAIIAGDKVLTSTYGYQLNTYSINGEMIESAFPFEDYATSLALTSHNKILAGGRGAFLSLFGFKGNAPQLIQTVRFK